MVIVPPPQIYDASVRTALSLVTVTNLIAITPLGTALFVINGIMSTFSDTSEAVPQATVRGYELANNDKLLSCRIELKYSHLPLVSAIDANDGLVPTDVDCPVGTPAVPLTTVPIADKCVFYREGKSKLK